MFRRPAEQTPIQQYVEKVKVAVRGSNAAQDIRNAIAVLLKSYGIKTPD